MDTISVIKEITYTSSEGILRVIGFFEKENHQTITISSTHSLTGFIDTRVIEKRDIIAIVDLELDEAMVLSK